MEIKKTKDLLLKKKEYNFYDLCEVVRVLRSEEGCPWDREQNHQSIRNDFIEETYEVIEAIDNRDNVLLKEELGDVLLQVVFHAVLEEEQGNYDIDAISSDICKKLIHRHPHVFGDLSLSNSDQVLENWDKIKSVEKSRNTVYSSMKSVPPMLPALMRARKIGSRAAKVGFDFSGASQAIEKVREETNELYESIETNNAFEELGDLLFSVVNVARLLKIDPEEALNHSTNKFMNRFGKMEELIESDGKNIQDLTMNDLENYYIISKNSTNVQK